MISFIEGIVESAGPLSVVLNCNGIGYQIDVPVTTAEKVPPIGQSIRLHIHPVYREDSQSLYGFSTPQERDFFHLITSKVSGIGPRIGLNLFSRLSFGMLQSAIANGDAALLTQCPGIGRKTAERLCIELRGKVTPTPAPVVEPKPGQPLSTHPSPSPYISQDAVQELITLGYKLEAADKAVRKALAADPPPQTADALIKAALGTTS
jgi:Holliday junction DNA helicase RuvA